MDQKILVAIILMFLLSPMYSMSDDGGNVPVVQKENASKEVSQAKQKPILASNQNSETKPNETVKDRFGFDTGMTKEKLENFMNEYKNKFMELFPNYRENAYERFFNNKINLNSLDEFEKIGLNLHENTHISGNSYLENSLKSDIILTGRVVELQQKDENFVPRYKLEIDKIFKGSEIINQYLGEIPKEIYFVAFLGISIDISSELDKKGIYFLNIDPLPKKEFLFLKQPYSTITVYNDSIVCYERDFNKFDSAFKFKHGEIELTKAQKDSNHGERYLKWYDECKIGNLNETINQIKKILEINDDKNFYKRSYSQRRNNE